MNTMAKTKSDAEVTKVKNPGSGAITDPRRAKNPPAEAPTPPSDGESNPDTSGLKASKRLTANDRLEADYDFEVVQAEDPRGDRGPEDANTQESQANDGESAVERMLRIKYRGEEQDIPEADAVTMVQQYKMMDQNYGPLHSLAKQIADATGISDPQQIADMLVAGEFAPKQQQPEMVDPNDPQYERTVGEAASEINDITAPTVPFNEPDAQAQQQANAMAQAFFDNNGLDPTDEAFNSMANMIKYSNQMSQVAQVLPQLMQDVQAFKAEQQNNAIQSQKALVDATASSTAQELGIDTPEEFNDFISWVNMQNQSFPGFQDIISQNPQSMDKAIRDYHAIATGNRNTKEQMALKEQVAKDVARAGGETVASRGSDTPGQAPRVDFNDEMLGLV